MKDPERTSYLNKAKNFLSTPAGIAPHFSAPPFSSGHCLSHHHNEDFICRLETFCMRHNAAAEYSAGAAGITAVFLSDQKNRLFMQSGRDCAIFLRLLTCEGFHAAERFCRGSDLGKRRSCHSENFPVYQLVLIGVMADCIRGASGMQHSEIEGDCSAPLPRILGLVLVLACGFGANHLWYANQALYDSYPTVDNPYFQVNQYNTRGMIYSFLHQFNIMQVKHPKGIRRRTY